MRLRAYLTTISVGAIVVIGVATIGRRDREPVYEGKRVSEWLADLGAGSRDERWRANEAIRHFGAEGVPTINQMLRAREFRLKRWVAEHSRGRVHYTPAGDIRQRALAACVILGPTAKGAVPALVNLMRRSPDGGQAAYTLAFLGPEGREALISSLTNENDAVRGCAVWAFVIRNTKAEGDVPALVATLGNPNPAARKAVLSSLAQINSLPELVVPAVVPTLSDTNEGVRMQALECLVQFGERAKEAGPAIARLLNAPQLSVRIQAIYVLNKTSPAAAAQAKVNPENLAK